MTMCWNVEPRIRPTFPKLVTAVDDVIKTLIRARADDDGGMHVIAVGQSQYINTICASSSSSTSDPIAVDYLTPTIGTFVFDHPLTQQVIEEVDSGVRPTLTMITGDSHRPRRSRLPTVGHSDTAMSEDGSDEDENASLFARRRRRIGGEMSDSGVICALSRRGYSVSEETSSNSDSVNSPRTDVRMDVFGEGQQLMRQPIPPPWCPPV